MKLKSWLHSFGRNPRRTRCDAPPAAIEHMEDRTLLSVAALFVNGELFVSSDGGDSITIRQNAASRVEVLANGVSLGTTPNVLTSAVTSIVVKGGDDANNINLNEVTNVTYPSLGSVGSIRVDAGNGDDTILGSPFYGDSVLGGDGKDTITGQAGADTIDGGDGTDSIVGGGGDDSLIGEDGSDTISGDDGNDVIFGGDHQDLITGGLGNDTIDAGQNNDTVNGGDGDDFINGMDGVDALNGDGGNDSILGGSLNDVISGGDGNDTVLGQSGNDVITGDAGDDSLNGGEGNDVVSGLLGNDNINGAGGNDSVFGNEGNDTLLGGSGNDTLDGFIGDDLLFGQGGSDSLIGGGGADSMDGGAGNDIVDSADPIPGPVTVTISVTGGSVLEGNAGQSLLPFTLTLSQASFLPISVNVATGDGIATLADLDYTAVNQTVTFAPGQTTATVSVVVQTNVVNEPNENVRLVLSNPTNGAQLLNQEASGIITNDDAPPPVLLATDFFFGELNRINPATGASTFVANTIQTTDIVSTGPNRLVGYNGNTLFNINPNTGAANVIAFVPGPFGEGDLAYDATTNFLYLVGSQPVGNPNLFRVDLATNTLTNLGEILVGTGNLAAATDNVEFDYLAFRNGTLFGVISGDVTGTNATFDDALFSINPATAVATRVGALGVGVDLAQGTGAMDYDAVADNFVLLDGVSGTLFRVNPTTGAATPVGNTGLFSGAGLAFVPLDALAQRSVSVSNFSVVEGDQGTRTVQFQVAAQPGAGNVTVNYQTVDGTATAGSDYTAVTGTLNFGPGGGVQTVTVTVSSDYSFESNESFFLQLTSATGAAIAGGSGVATITNDDTAPLGDTVLGGTGNDTLIGGPSDDFMNGGEGNDLIFGNGGNDTILGGSGIDTINGGEGDDSIDGQGGQDVIDSGNGDDIFVWNGGSSGNDTVTNTSGADSVLVRLNGASNVVTIGQSAVPVGGVFSFLQVTEGGATLTIDSSIAQITVDGGAGDDTITVTDIDRVCRGAVIVRGGTGDDLLTGVNAKIGPMRLRMEGGDGQDSIIGTQGDDTLAGDAGIDRIKGGLGNDLILGGVGIDSLNGDAGNDTLIGGDGSDTLVGDGADTLFGDAGNDSLSGDQGADILSGGDGDDTANGGDGNDTITGDLGNDSLLGGSALDSLTGGDGNDTLDGGRNDDVLNGGAGNDKMRGDHGNDTILGGSGNDTINGGDGDDVINGQSGDDLMTGADGDDFVNGADGKDIITGGDGDDTLLGGDGKDTLLGEQGDDLINGQADGDCMSGGQGDDTLVAAAAGEINEQFVLSAAILSDLNAN